MGIGVSTTRMASSVAKSGHLGVVSGTAIDTVIVRRLQDGDISGEIRSSLESFPDQTCVRELLDRYYIEGGKDPNASYIDTPKLSISPTVFASQLLAMASYAEVMQAKKGHDGNIGINLLEKIQLATPASVYGAILAGVDYLLVGAGVPSEIPQLITTLLRGEIVHFPIKIQGAEKVRLLEFDPKVISGVHCESLHRPYFLAIVSSHILANYLARNDETRPDGFIVEGPVAGGHNAPPRNKDSIDVDGQSVFSERDNADIEKLSEIGLPFWLAGGFGSPEKIKLARELGATGVQIGSLFALSEESGITEELKKQILTSIVDDTIDIRTEPHASATGFPFKVVSVTGTVSDEEIFLKRQKQCDMGYLRSPYLRPSGGVGYRCSAEPEQTFHFKGGDSDSTSGVRCLCNALIATIGLGQVRWGTYSEPALITLGSDLSGCKELWQIHRGSWSAQDVINFLTSTVPQINEDSKLIIQ